MVLLAVVPATVLTADQAMRDRDTQRQAALDDAMRAVQATAREEALFVATMRHLLDGLADRPGIREAEPGVCAALLNGVIAERGEVADLSVLDMDGRQLCSASPEGQVADPDEAQAVLQRAAGEGGSLHSSVHVAAGSGAARLLFARALPPPRDAGASFVVAEVRLDRLVAGVDALLLPPGSSVLVVDPEGAVALRHPDEAAWVGQRLPDAPLVAAMAQAREGTVATLGLDGVPRVYAYTSLGEEGDPDALRFAVGIPQAHVFGPAEAAFRRNLATLSVVALLVAAGAWVTSERLVVRPVRSLAGAARRIGAGDLKARSGVDPRAGDLGLLAKDFDHMAAALQAHVAAEARTRQRLEEANRRLREVEGLKTAFINHAAHELRTPLTGLRLQAHLLRRRSEGRFDDAQARAMDHIDGNLARLERLVQDLVLASRLHAGRLHQVREVCDLRGLVDAAVRTQAEGEDEHHIRWQVEAPTAPVQVQADPAALARALEVALDRARGRCRAGGVVQVRTAVVVARHGRRAEVRVRAEDGTPRHDGAPPTTAAPSTPTAADRPPDPGGAAAEPLSGWYLAQRILATHGGALTARETPAAPLDDLHAAGAFEVTLYLPAEPRPSAVLPRPQDPGRSDEASRLA